MMREGSRGGLCETTLAQPEHTNAAVHRIIKMNDFMISPFLSMGKTGCATRLTFCLPIDVAPSAGFAGFGAATVILSKETLQFLRRGGVGSRSP